MVRPATQGGQWHHSHMMAGLSPFDGKRSKTSPLCGRRGTGMCPVLPAHTLPVPPQRESGERVQGGVGRQGTGLALHPGLQVLPLVFCLNEAAGLNVACNLQPKAKPCQSPFPRLFKNERARPSFPRRTVRYGTSQGPVKCRGARPASPPHRGTHRHSCSLQNT